MTQEQHIVLFRNAFLSDENGKYVLGNLLMRLGFFSVCKTEKDIIRRNFALELLQDCGIVLDIEDAGVSEKSTQKLIEMMAKQDILPYLMENKQ